MKNKIYKFISFIFSFLLLISMIPSISAIEARASDYFAATGAWATAIGRGKFVVEFDINATKIMDEVGATKILIKERQSDGSYDIVKTFTRYNTTSLIEKNSSCAYAKVSYTGTPGTKYYASVTLYAKDSNGSEKMGVVTNTITA